MSLFIFNLVKSMAMHQQVLISSHDDEIFPGLIARMLRPIFKASLSGGAPFLINMWGLWSVTN